MVPVFACFIKIVGSSEFVSVLHYIKSLFKNYSKLLSAFLTAVIAIFSCSIDKFYCSCAHDLVSDSESDGHMTNNDSDSDGHMTNNDVNGWHNRN